MSEELSNYEDSSYFKMGKMLTAVDKEERDNAVHIIKKNVCLMPQISKLDMMKLWKGLFYTFWMSDKPEVQEELAISLVEFVPLFINKEMADLYIVCFMETMAREWGGIDHLRLDKYCLLVRLMLRQCLVRVKESKYAQKEIDFVIHNIFDLFVYKNISGLSLLIFYSFLPELSEADHTISTPVFMKLILPFLEYLEGPQSSKLFADNLYKRFFSSLCTDFITKSDHPLSIEPGEGNQLENVDLRFLYDILKSDVLDPKKCSNGHKRHLLFQLEALYESTLEERFDSLVPPKEEKKPKETVQKKKNMVTKTKVVSKDKPKKKVMKH